MTTNVTLNATFVDTPAIQATGYRVLEIRFDEETNTASMLVLANSANAHPVRWPYPFGPALHTALLNDALAVIKAKTGANGATIANT